MNRLQDGPVELKSTDYDRSFPFDHWETKTIDGNFDGTSQRMV